MFKMVLGAQALDTKKSFQSLSSLTEKTCWELKLWMFEILKVGSSSSQCVDECSELKL